MWLINTSTYQLHQVVDPSDTRYAILSHRWQDDEVSFSDIQNLKIARSKKGFRKIEGCCAIARGKRIEYAWIDTCCINKDSSAELSEAINSMFRWYRDADVCFAYLADVDEAQVKGWRKSEIFESQWFVRGWTLQELLAPSDVVFYDANWLELGTKKSLSPLMAGPSKIPVEVLRGTRSIFTYTISQRMFWAAHRMTTREEDRAYSLMGLFNVNMPMLYGEGRRAFIRLQEEILKHSADHSIFAWTGIQTTCTGLLACSPEQFSLASLSLYLTDEGTEDYADITNTTDTDLESEPYEMTNQGLSITFEMTPWFSKTYLALLKGVTCINRDLGFGTQPLSIVGIFLQHVGGRQYRRVALPMFGDVFHERDGHGVGMRVNTNRFKRRRVYVRQHELSLEVRNALPFDCLPVYGLRLAPIPGVDSQITFPRYAAFLEESGTIMLEPGSYGPIAQITLSNDKDTDVPISTIKIGLNFNFEPMIAVKGSTSDSLEPTASWTTDVRFRNFDLIDFSEEHGWDAVEPAYSRLAEARPNLHIYQCNDPTGTSRISLSFNKPLSYRYNPSFSMMVAKQEDTPIWYIQFNVYSHSTRPGRLRSHSALSPTSSDL